MIQVSIQVTVDSITINFDKEEYSHKVSGGNSVQDIEKAQAILLEGYQKIKQALDSQK